MILIIKIISETDAVEYCKNRAASHIECARLDLPQNINQDVKFLLEQIADFVINRRW